MRWPWALLGKRKGKDNPPSSFQLAKYKALHSILVKWCGLKRRVADFLFQRSRHWSRLQQKIFLALFVIVAQFISLGWLLLEWKHHPYQLPAANTLPPPPSIPLNHWKPRLTTADSIYLARFRQQIDSLIATPDGRDSLAAFNRRRPGYIDSVLYLERLTRRKETK